MHQERGDPHGVARAGAGEAGVDPALHEDLDDAQAATAGKGGGDGTRGARRGSPARSRVRARPACRRTRLSARRASQRRSRRPGRAVRSPAPTRHARVRPDPARRRRRAAAASLRRWPTAASAGSTSRAGERVTVRVGVDEPVRCRATGGGGSELGARRERVEHVAPGEDEIERVLRRGEVTSHRGPCRLRLRGRGGITPASALARARSTHQALETRRRRSALGARSSSCAAANVRIAGPEARLTYVQRPAAGRSASAIRSASEPDRVEVALAYSSTGSRSSSTSSCSACR